ncbi:MAG: hypothetical protein ACRBDL_06000 [Alphaproteobacteria bacterium]
MQPDPFEHIAVSRDYDRRARLLIPSHNSPVTNCSFITIDEQVIELKNSEDVNAYDLLNDDIILGSNFVWQCYCPHIDRYKQPPGTQCGLWDAHTGKPLLEIKGHHFGRVHGGQLLDENTFMTWADDFLIHIWDRKTGERLKTMPIGIELFGDHTPPWQKEENKRRLDNEPEEAQARHKKYQEEYKQRQDEFALTPYVCSRAFSEWSPERRRNYIKTQEEFAFNVKLLFIDTDQDKGFIDYQYKVSPPPRKYQQYDGENVWDCFDELTGASAGYSHHEKLTDGRWIISGTTYGTNDRAYVWDGGQNLTLLALPDPYDTGLETITEKPDGGLEFDGYMGTPYTFYGY